MHHAAEEAIARQSLRGTARILGLKWVIKQPDWSRTSALPAKRDGGDSAAGR